MHIPCLSPCPPQALLVGKHAVASLRVSAAVAGHDKDINTVAVAPNDSLIATVAADPNGSLIAKEAATVLLLASRSGRIHALKMAHMN
eukprot:1154560-Pelagomonas_calceolata.AAC.8